MDLTGAVSGDQAKKTILDLYVSIFALISLVAEKLSSWVRMEVETPLLCSLFRVHHNRGERYYWCKEQALYQRCFVALQCFKALALEPSEYL